MSWYQDIVDDVRNVAQTFKVVWTKPYEDEIDNSLTTMAGSGIYDKNGTLVGISTIDWGIEEVIETLSQEIHPTEGSFVLLCVPEKDYVIINTLNGDSGTSVKEIPWDINAGSFKMNGTEYIVISRVLDNGWFMSVQIPANEIFAEVESKNKHFSLIIFFSTVFILCGAFYLISKQLNKPLKRLTDGVSQLGLGNLDARIDVAANDELGLLAQTFNKMTGDLKESIENYTREHSEKERIGTELNVATRIQASMLPCIFPAFPERNEFDIYATMNPAKEVGGDFYDFFLIDENRLAVVIADVSDKGVPAALFMVIAKTLIKNNAQSGKPPKEVFETVNNTLCENNEAFMFVTAFMGILDIPTGRFTYVNAGHNPPLVKCADTDYVWLPVKPGFVLAGKAGIPFKQDEITLNQGDTLFMYTDGVTEAKNPQGKLFTEARLVETANRYGHSAPKELIKSVKSEIDTFADGAQQADDITMLVIKIAENRPIKVLDIEAKIENLNTVLDFIAGELKVAGCPAKLQTKVKIAVEEIFTNIAHYAYAPNTGGVAIRITSGDEIVIEFEDEGKPYNPLEKEDPDITAGVEKREMGGLGIFMVKNIMDTVEYQREGNKNILRIKKERA
jgi:sigma-B regulation protein RsbU (phosphoserine phosphatase)